MKFIHLADVHLGAVPDRGTAWSSSREEEIWTTFRRIIAGIRENPVDLLLISGDLFHRRPLRKELREVNSLFAAIPETNVYIIAGNHDYMDGRSAYGSFEWADNVIFFDSEEVMCVDDDRVPVTVYGLSLCRNEVKEPLLDGVCPEKGEGYHILLAHGGDEKHVPIDFSALASAGFDYVALGHIHKPKAIVKDRIVYPGSPEPLDRNETGKHGYVEGFTDSEGNIHTRFVPASARIYEDITLVMDEDTTQNELEEKLSDMIEEKGQKNIYRVVLTGQRSPDLMLLPEKLKGCGNIVEIRDESRLMYDLELLEKKYAGTLVGDYIRYFSLKDTTEIDEKALDYGLQALLETSMR